MKPQPRKPTEPRPAQETTRHSVIALLGDQPLSAKEISAMIHITEKEVYSHLEHIRLSLHASGGGLEVTPAACRGCGFIFAKRDRLTPPASARSAATRRSASRASPSAVHEPGANIALHKRAQEKTPRTMMIVRGVSTATREVSRQPALRALSCA